jgi:predicted O-methyltransferase YrrM
MGVEGADWLDRPEREREEQPQKVIAALHLTPGVNVGEVGAGTGFYALRIAKRIQPGGTYYANDLEPAMLTRLESKVAAQKVTNIKTIVGTQPIRACLAAHLTMCSWWTSTTSFHSRRSSSATLPPP